MPTPIKLVLGFFLALFLAACGSGPNSVAIDYTRAVAEGKHDAAVAMMDPAMLILGEGKIKAALSLQKTMIDSMGGIKKISVENEQTEGDRAVVTLKVEYGNGTSDTENVALKKIDGKWKVSSGR